jgi:hypothetical protein
MTSEPTPLDWRERADRVRAAAIPRDLSCFDGLQRFCIFVGQSRSGHSVVATLLNAHRHAVVSHNLDALGHLHEGVDREHLFLLILERDRWLGEQDREIGGYSYDVEGLWLGDHGDIRVIGDKRAGATSRLLSAEPGRLRTLADEVGLPVHVIHHVRNPWDNISSIWSRRTLGVDRTLSEAADHYFEMLDGAVRGLAAAAGELRWLRTYHEDLIATPSPVLEELFGLLELPVDAPFLDACAAFIHAEPRRTRQDAPWTQGLIRDVEARVREFAFLDRYSFDV